MNCSLNGRPYWVISVVLVGILLAQAASAHAAFPGANGKIAFESNRTAPSYEIYTIDADGANLTRLTNNSFTDGGAAWSPDGTKIAFHSQRNGTFDIYSMSADGTGEARLTTNPAADMLPAWSPDGTKIAFMTNRDGDMEIYSMNADGTNQTRLTNTPATDDAPAWSPDGTKIAFRTNRDGGNYDIYTMNADGTNPTRLTNNPANDANPSWSPDGTKIAFDTDRDGNNEIYTMNADGTNQTRLTTSVPGSLPSWSPDGTKIAFSGFSDSNYEIYTMNADGTNQARLTNNSAFDGLPDWQPIPQTYVRPKGASPMRVSLVPASQQCSAPNRSHGAPLSFPSCAPPAPTSSFVTVGTPEVNGGASNSIGAVLLRVRTSTPADVFIFASITDVRCRPAESVCGSSNAADGPDYTGQLEATAQLRMTDRRNAPDESGGSGPGTVQDVPISFPLACSSTVANIVGSACTANTSANALMPGWVASGERAVWQLGQFQVFDGGASGMAGSSDATLFEDEGIFTP